MRKFEARVVSGIRLLAAVGVVALLPTAALPASTETADRGATVSWDVVDAVTTLSLDTATLSSLGVETTVAGDRVSGHVKHPLSVIPDGAPSFAADVDSNLSGVIGWDGFRGFEEGSVLRHRGGVTLRRGSRTLDFADFELKAGARAGDLEFVDARGVPYLATAAAQWELDTDGRQLRYMNADVRVLPAFAEWLGDARYADMTVGVLDLDANLSGGPIPPPPTPDGAGPPPCGDWSGNVDVGLVNMSSVTSAGVPGVVNGRSVTVVLPSAELENVGTANVPWYSQFTNLGVPPHNDQHPYLVWQMLRSSNGVLEPIGRNDLKHGFLTINIGCDAGACTDSHVLGLGCADVYGTSTNNTLGRLAFRPEITASTGVWAHCGGIPSHFDANGDCAQDPGFSSGENSFTHGLKAAETDLSVAGALYYVEAFYIVKDDINIFNSMGYRRVTPAKPASTWTFATVGAYAQGPAINTWVNPTTPGPGADNELLDTGQGRVQLAVKTTDLGGGVKRYAYAFQNHDFDRRISSFHVPFDATIGNVQNITYADGDGFATNDWTAVANASGITWTAPVATTPPAPIDYATLVSFRFDSTREPVAVSALLGVFEAGSPTSLTLATLAPVSNFSVTPTSGLVTTEAGGTASFTVVLDSAPTGDVSFNLTSSDPTEGSVSPGSLTFTTSDWSNAAAHTVTVTGVNDAIDDGAVGFTIQTGNATSTDLIFDGQNPPDVGVSNTDDDVAGITVAPTSGLVTTEANGQATFTIVLTSEPTVDVTIGLASSNTNEGTVAPPSVTLTSGDWTSPRRTP